MLQEPGNNHYKLHVFLADFVYQCHKFEVENELLHKDYTFSKLESVLSSKWGELSSLEYSISHSTQNAPCTHAGDRHNITVNAEFAS